MAGGDLARAMDLAGQCARQEGGLQAAWKLLGDVHVQHYSATPAVAAGGSPAQKCAALPRASLKLPRGLDPHTRVGGEVEVGQLLCDRVLRGGVEDSVLLGLFGSYW